MANRIVSAPGLLLASRIAWRSEAGPLSSVFSTLKVLGSERSSSDSSCGRKRRDRGRRAEGVSGARPDRLFVQMGNHMTRISFRELVCGTMKRPYPGRADLAPGAVHGR